MGITPCITVLTVSTVLVQLSYNPKIHLSIGKCKKIGGAVVRSRVRRILREAYRHIEARRPLKKGFLLVFAAREASATMKSTEMASQLGYALKRLEMYEK